MTTPTAKGVVNGLVARSRPWIVLTLTLAAAIALAMSVNGVLDLRVDAGAYSWQIESFAAGQHTVANHLDYRLLYPAIGGGLFHTTHPLAFILGANITFYAVLAAASYLLLRALDFTEGEATVGTVWIVSAYPLLKYGLALGTDMSGWAMSALTLLVGVAALKKDSIRMLVVASTVGLVGCATRETGAAGLLTLFLLVPWRYRARGPRIVLARAAVVVLPAVILYLIVFIPRATDGSIFGDWMGWILSNRVAAASTGRETWRVWLGVEASTFSVCWVGAADTAIRVLRRQHVEHLDVAAAAFLATLPALIWPFYVSRVLFIQFLWVVPLALDAYAHLRRRYESAPPARRRLVVGLAAGAPVATNVALFLLSGGQSLFDVLRSWR